MNGITTNDMLAFSELLTAHTDDDDDGGLNQAVTPGSFGAAAPARLENGSSGSDLTRKVKDPKDIWDIDEVPPEEAILAEDFNDPRPRPKYDIFYKQVSKR